jgi:hypothetical protein
MKKLAVFACALLVTSSAFAQFGPGRDGGRDGQGFGRGRGGFDRCGYNPNGRNYWNDLKGQIEDVIQDAQDIQAQANFRFSGAESRTFNDGRVVDAYLAMGSLLGQAQATLAMTQANDWSNWDRYNTASDRANVGQAVDNLQRAAQTIRSNDQFDIYMRLGRAGMNLGQRLDCDIQDLRKITDALNDDWRRGRPGQGGGFPGGPGGRGDRPFPGGPVGPGGFPGGPGGRGGQRSDRGTATVTVSLDSFLEVIIGPNGPRVGRSDGDPQGRTRLIGGSVDTTDRRNDPFRNLRDVQVRPRNGGNNQFNRISTVVNTDPRTGEIKIMFTDTQNSSGTDTFDISWAFD